MRKRFEFNFYISLIMENFPLIFLSCALNILQPVRNTPGQWFSYLYAWFLMLAIMALVIGLSVYGLLRKPHLHYFSAFFEGLHTERLSGLLYPSLFILRRLIFCLSALFLAEVPLLQLYLFQASSLLHLLLLTHSRPFLSASR